MPRRCECHIGFVHVSAQGAVRVDFKEPVASFMASVTGDESTGKCHHGLIHLLNARFLSYALYVPITTLHNDLPNTE